MPKYEVLLGPIATDEVFQTGDTIELEQADAQPLLKLNVIQAIEEAPKPKEGDASKPESKKPSKPTES